ncbi:hypothetical protein DFH11DRAFT_1545840 [Phellopilus nigrolimitatus]|nr:hypothetical protein DFH11DRAFT_1545840 [Phellopilus nigrolimitatus]
MPFPQQQNGFDRTPLAVAASTRYSRPSPKVFVRSSTWLYVAVKPLVKPKSAAPYDVFLFVGAILLLGGIFFVHHVYGDVLPSWFIVAVPVLLIIIFSRLLAVPSSPSLPQIRRPQAVVADVENIGRRFTRYHSRLCPDLRLRSLQRNISGPGAALPAIYDKALKLRDFSGVVKTDAKGMRRLMERKGIELRAGNATRRRRGRSRKGRRRRMIRKQAQTWARPSI